MPIDREYDGLISLCLDASECKIDRQRDHHTRRNHKKLRAAAFQKYGPEQGQV
jgi:hypothetical protein